MAIPKRTTCAVSLVLLLTIAVPSGQALISDPQAAQECTLSDAEQLLAPPSQDSGAENSLMESQYNICTTFTGSCSATTSGSLSVTESAKWYIFKAVRKLVVKDSRTTTLDCSGSVSTTFTHFGGIGARGVETRLGDVGASSADASVAGMDPILDALPSASGDHYCEYVAGINRCQTKHTAPWTLKETFAGHFETAEKAVRVCAPFDVRNAPLIPDVGGLVAPVLGLVTDSIGGSQCRDLDVNVTYT